MIHAKWISSHMSLVDDRRNRPNIVNPCDKGLASNFASVIQRSSNGHLAPPPVSVPLHQLLSSLLSPHLSVRCCSQMAPKAATAGRKRAAESPISVVAKECGAEGPERKLPPTKDLQLALLSLSNNVAEKDANIQRLNEYISALRQTLGVATDFMSSVSGWTEEIFKEFKDARICRKCHFMNGTAVAPVLRSEVTAKCICVCEDDCDESEDDADGDADADASE